MAKVQKANGTKQPLKNGTAKKGATTTPAPKAPAKKKPVKQLSEYEINLLLTMEQEGLSIYKNGRLSRELLTLLQSMYNHGLMSSIRIDGIIEACFVCVSKRNRWTDTGRYRLLKQLEAFRTIGFVMANYNWDLKNNRLPVLTSASTFGIYTALVRDLIGREYYETTDGLKRGIDLLLHAVAIYAIHQYTDNGKMPSPEAVEYARRYEQGIPKLLTMLNNTVLEVEGIEIDKAKKGQKPKAGDYTLEQLQSMLDNMKAETDK